MNITKSYLAIYSLLLSSVGLVSCGNRSNSPELKIPNAVKKTGIKVEVLNLEKDVMDLQNAKNINQHIQNLKKKYGIFFYEWAENIMQMGNIDDPTGPSRFQSLISYPENILVHQKINAVYGDYSDFKTKLNEAFERFHFGFPEQKIPKVLTLFTNFSQDYYNSELKPRFTDSSGNRIIALSIEMHLGDTNSIYNNRLEEWELAYATPEYALVRVMQVTAAFLLDDVARGKRSLDEMIYWGKILYFAKNMLPNFDEAKLMGYSKEQTGFLNANEKEIWNYYIKDKSLYSSDFGTYRHFFVEGLSTFKSGIPEGCPPRIGKWTGWKIIDAYMKKNKSVTLPQLLKESDNDKILRLSEYHPE